MRELLKRARESRVEHRGHKDTYFTGTRVAGLSGDKKGKVTFLIGPDYTCPNYIREETVGVKVDGMDFEPDFEMCRLRGSGIFFGEDVFEDISISLFEWGRWKEGELVRIFAVENRGGKERNLSLKIRQIPGEHPFGVRENRGWICAKEGVYCFGNQETKNWQDRRMTSGFEGEDSRAVKDEEGLSFEAERRVPAGEMEVIAFVRKFSYVSEDNDTKEDGRISEVGRCWQEEIRIQWDQCLDWLAMGDWKGRIKSREDQDMIESLLMCVRMQQNRDGGSIAGIRKYANSYIRDTHGGMRLFLAAGHTLEVGELLLNIHAKWEKAGFIPNWWSMGSDTFIGHSFYCDMSEITAYYLFMARDYQKAGGDEKVLEKIRPSLAYAAHAQIDWLRTHQMTLPFNGDETEQYCVNRDGEEYGGFINPEYPFAHDMISFPSMAAAYGSIAFYDRLSGEDHGEFLKELALRIRELFFDPEKKSYAFACRIREDGSIWRHPGTMTNYKLFPLWLSVPLPGGEEVLEAKSCLSFVREGTGFLPNCPECMEGFCGHTLGLLLYDLVKAKDQRALQVAATIKDSGILSQYGTVSEFYGPSGVPNGHNCRAFEGGIVGEALLLYLRETWE